MSITLNHHTHIDLNLAVTGTSDVMLDLHCDQDAVLHMYTHTRLWPHMRDLALELQAHCTLLAEVSGDEPIDEVCSSPWAALAGVYVGIHVCMHTYGSFKGWMHLYLVYEYHVWYNNNTLMSTLTCMHL